MQHLRRSVGVDDQSSSLVYLQRKVGFFKIGRRWLWQNGQLYYVYLSSYKYLQIETDATGICISELNYITIGVMIKELIKIDFSACSKDTPRCISADMLRMLDRRGSLHKQTNEGWSERKQENNSKAKTRQIHNNTKQHNNTNTKTQQRHNTNNNKDKT